MLLIVDEESSGLTADLARANPVKIENIWIDLVKTTWSEDKEITAAFTPSQVTRLNLFMVPVKLVLRCSGHRKVHFKPIHYKLQPRIPKHRVWIRVRVRVHYEHIFQMVSTLNKRLFYYYFFFATFQHNFMIFFQIYTVVDPRSLLEGVKCMTSLTEAKKISVGDK